LPGSFGEPEIPMPDAPPSRPTASPLLEAIAALANRRSLTESQTTAVFATVMQGEATPAQIAALLIGLRAKGETADEIAGAARAMREAMVPVQAAGDHLVAGRLREVPDLARLVQDGEVVFRTRVFSRLASPLARLGGPVSRAVQFAALDRYVTAVTAAGREPVDRG